MNSDRRVQLLLGAMVAALLVTQWRGARRVDGLERQLAQLRTELTHQQPPPVREEQVAMAQPDAVEPEPVRLARASVQRELAAWPELTEDELDHVVAGELGPAPGLAAAAATGPGATPPPVETQSSTSPESAPQRLAPRVEKGGVLLRKGRTQVEPTISYSHLSKNRVGLSGFSIFDVIFIGEIQAEEVDRDLLTGSVNIRHGVTNNLQVEAELPAQLQREETLSGSIDARDQNVTRYHGVNDMNAGIFYQFRREDQRFPAMIGHMRVKAPTGKAPRFGSGVWGVKSGLLFVKTSDPVALFTNLGYTHTFSGKINRVEVNPGDAFEYNVGMAYALNYNLSANASFEQIFVGEATQNGVSVPGSRLVVANLKGGLTYAITKNFSVDFSVGTGLTEDSPDVTATVSFPYTF